MLKNENSQFDIASTEEFSAKALALFRQQYTLNPVYRAWVDYLKVKPTAVASPDAIPFLPIETFKNHVVATYPVHENTTVFTSSATTSQQPSRHYVLDTAVYETSFTRGFEQFYGSPSEYCILALLPNYLQRGGSSLVYMVNRLIQLSQHPLSGFFLDNTEQLRQTLTELKGQQQKTLLIGTSYALLDFCSTALQLDENFIVMETGGMKGTRKEMLKPELHQHLKAGFGVQAIHSEYGMTELLSQAYSPGDGVFKCPSWMKVLVREVDDPLSAVGNGKTGGINVIDLANTNSCAFVATKDLGRVYADGSFELMGRYDHSDVRGCNLMTPGF